MKPETGKDPTSGSLHASKENKHTCTGACTHTHTYGNICVYTHTSVGIHAICRHSHSIGMSHVHTPSIGICVTCTYTSAKKIKAG